MKKNLLFLLLCLFTISCNNNEGKDNLRDFTNNYHINSKKYKVICFLPADGCSHCIDPTLDYMQVSGEKFLLVLSYYEKKESVDEVLKTRHINRSKVLIDTDHIAIKNLLMTPIAPCFYFLKRGRVVKKIDLTNTSDKSSVLKEVEEYIADK